MCITEKGALEMICCPASIAMLALQKMGKVYQIRKGLQEQYDNLQFYQPNKCCLEYMVNSLKFQTGA